MRAAQLDRYANEDRLVVREIPVPEPNADEILIKVRAAAVNPLELLLVRGEAFAEYVVVPETAVAKMPAVDPRAFPLEQINDALQLVAEGSIRER